MICRTPPGLHHKKVQSFGNITQFSLPHPPPPFLQNHTQRETPLHQSNVVLDQGLRGMCDLKRDRPKNAKIFCKTFVHDCLILPHREPIDIPYPGRFRYVLIAICNTYFRLTRFKLQVFTRSKIPTQATKQAMPALYSGGDIFCQPD